MNTQNLNSALETLRRYMNSMNSQAPNSALESIRRYTIAGIVVVLILTCGVGVWATTTEISGALIAPGTIVVDSNIKKVQHPTGGIVGEVRVREGDRVKAGDILVRLDDTVTASNLAIVTKGLTELSARKARLEAERDGAETINFPDNLVRQANDPEVAQVLTAERKLFDLRRSARAGQKAQLGERIKQLEEETTGLSAQKVSKEKEIALIERELGGVRELFQKNLVPMTRLTSLEREATRLGGESGQLVASIAQAKGKPKARSRNSGCRSFRSIRIFPAKSPRRCGKLTVRSENLSSAKSPLWINSSASIFVRRKTERYSSQLFILLVG